MTLRSCFDQIMEEACTEERPPSAQLAFPFFPGPFEVRRIALGAGAGSHLRVDLGPWGAELTFWLPATRSRLDQMNAICDAALAKAESLEDERRQRHASGESDAFDEERTFGEARVFTEDVTTPPPLRSWHIDLRFIPRAKRQGPWPQRDVARLIPCLGLRRQESFDTVHALVVFFAAAQRVIAGVVDRHRLRAVAPLLVAAVAYIPPALNPQALAAARRFPASQMLHAFVFDAVAEDPSGRLNQIVDTCPGLLLIAKCLAMRDDEDAVQEILAAIIEGRKLGLILGLAVEAWARQCARRDPSRPAPNATERAFQRQRIRHADAGLRPALLCARFAPGLAVEDIPRETVAQNRWFEIISSEALGASQRGAEALLSETQHRRFSAFISKHWRFLDGVASELAGSLGDLLPDLLDFLDATGRRVDRSSKPWDVLVEYMHWKQEGRPEEEDLEPFPPETALDTRGLQCWKADDTRIRPLRCVAELIDEGHRMRHCVADYAGRAVKGKVQIFHVASPTTDLTVMTERRGDGLAILTATGQDNRPLHAEEEALLKPWLEATTPPKL